MQMVIGDLENGYSGMLAYLMSNLSRNVMVSDPNGSDGNPNDAGDIFRLYCKKSIILMTGVVKRDGKYRNNFTARLICLF